MVHRFRILIWILFLFLIIIPKLIFGNSVLLKDGSVLKNVKTTLREDHVLVEDQFGKVEKIDLQLVEKILVSEIKKEETSTPKDFKKFYFSLIGAQWNSRVTESINLNRHYTFTDLITTTLYIDPYLEKKYSLKVQSVGLQGEYRINSNFGFSLALEHNSFLFPETAISPLVGIVTNSSLNTMPEYQTLAAISTTALILNLNSGGYKGDKQSGSKFTVSTLSLSPSIRYFFPISESISWFAQVGVGFGRSYESGIYSKQLTYGAALIGTGLQVEVRSYFFNLTFQYRTTDLNASVHSYRFNEPLVLVGIGIRM
ncbi:hypothetical protein JWG45_11460 [Leptospira sp. 201903070]|uniref:Outer membrane protein beta-barrel domain-containing protein n=1 Tax=Leptospira ainlahdjerensis TaxID=2810033 RepID=A0ABS2UBM1_9LEPT|nr:hypothetical protein [Leptospira ainlahdjerensis]